MTLCRVADDLIETASIVPLQSLHNWMPLAWANNNNNKLSLERAMCQPKGANPWMSSPFKYYYAKQQLVLI